MGTGVLLSVARDFHTAESAITKAADAVYERCREIDERFSPYRATSETTRYGLGLLSRDQTSDEFQEILDLCDKLYTATNGVFDIRKAGTQGPAIELQSGGVDPIDPSGAVKGWAIEQCVGILRSFDLSNFCVNIGGDLYAAGREREGQGWQVGLQHPEEQSAVTDVLIVEDLAVATSGVYERGEHIVRDNEELLSITAISSDITLADAYATAAFAMGRTGVTWLHGQRGFEVYAVTAEREVLRSPGLDRLLVRGASDGESLDSSPGE